jgi:hypothetical protein
MWYSAVDVLARLLLMAAEVRVGGLEGHIGVVFRSWQMGYGGRCA